jgi:HK97 family phage major capsid protein
VVRYVQEGTATNAAAGVAEGAAKPQSTLGFNTVDEPVKKVATVLPISDEMLEDAPAIQSFINGSLSLFVNLETERQLLRGTAGGAEVQGLLTSRGVAVYAGGTVAGNKAIQLFKAINGVRGSAFVEPDWVIMHPNDYQDIRLLTDNQGQLFGGGPFFGPYGASPTMADASGQVTGALDSLWGKRVYVTNAPGAGTAIVGTSSAGVVYSRGGLRVEASNAGVLGGVDMFTSNMVAIRAERRLGLATFRPSAYCEVRLS